jgi:hypothetical protein
MKYDEFFQISYPIRSDKNIMLALHSLVDTHTILLSSSLLYIQVLAYKNVNREVKKSKLTKKTYFS